MASVKVAVRVRPFNRRERDLDCHNVVEMLGNEVVLSSHDAKRHAFTFDFAYWSHDQPSAGAAATFAGQSRVYEDLGTDVVENAFGGYNACVFAYGQTGSGKTHTMMGSEEDRGLIPRICRALFDKMAQAKTLEPTSSTFRTEVSYLEIYNEKVKDLLQRDSAHSLRIREHPLTGPYVENLSRHLVVNFNDILNLMEKGNTIRTTAQTNMNDTSSRSHAIFTITFVNAGFSEGVPHETASKIHLVDLAGSERADATGATGKRLKEGAHINKSLVTLGSVISALAEISSSMNATLKRGAVPKHIPYRDSVLTWLLKDSLGGNSKTIMIATISPAEVNASETLSTLRYANRAKNIINKPTVNEDANVKLIRDLRDEIERLRRAMSLDPITLSLVQKELAVKEAQERTLTEEWTEKWKEAANILQEQKALALKRTGVGVMLDSDQPHLVGIDEDVLSTGITLYHLKEGETLIGTEVSCPDIALKGACLEDNHCRVVLEGGVATLIPFEGALCMVNASLIREPVKLSQGCVVVLGKTNMFRYNDPKEAASMRKNNSLHQRTPVDDIMNRSLLSHSLSDLRNTNRGFGQFDEKLHSSEGNIKEFDESIPVTTKDTAQLNLINESNESGIENPVNLSFNLETDPKPHVMANLACDLDETTNELYKKICEQKEVIMSCLESDQCDISALNGEITKLKLLQEQYSQSEIYNMRALWQSQSIIGDPLQGFDKKFSALVEQEVDRRLFQERVLKCTDAELQDRELLQIQRDKELLEMRRQHEQEIYVLRRKLHEAQQGQITASPSTPSSPAHPSSASFIPVNVTIERFHLKNGSHVEYEVNVSTPEESWSMSRRFRMFRDLHVAMSHQYGGVVQGLSFPARRLFGNTSEVVASERRVQLQGYMNSLIHACALESKCPLHACQNHFRSALERFSTFFQTN